MRSQTFASKGSKKGIDSGELCPWGWDEAHCEVRAMEQPTHGDATRDVSKIQKLEVRAAMRRRCDAEAETGPWVSHSAKPGFKSRVEDAIHGSQFAECWFP